MIINLGGERPENISPEDWEKLKILFNDIFKNEQDGSEQEAENA